MIGVLDYAAGNAPSVGYALTHLGIDHRLVATPSALDDCDRIILPGVGAAPTTLASLRSSGLLDALALRVQDGTPFFGICVGLQILLDHSAEGDVACLGWIPGKVARFPHTVRVPQMGWNTVQVLHDHPVTAEIPPNAYCYFVNSYFAQPDSDADVLATTDYSVQFASMLARNNIVATQFHAEKSGPVGLQLLANFARWDGQQ
ncbi:MAG: imidazole glycerol phosphate synthase subunit HisH [Acidimicrobiia bacterium]